MIKNIKVPFPTDVSILTTSVTLAKFWRTAQIITGFQVAISALGLLGILTMKRALKISPTQ